MKKTYLSIFAVCLSPLILASCSGAKETLGLERTVPDEFAVVKRAPLEMPPSYYLRPPRPGAPRPQEQTTDQQAKQTVFGEAAIQEEAIAQPENTTSSEALLLQQAGTNVADPAIRAKVDAETAELGDRNKPVAEKLLGLAGGSSEPSASVVDAAEESARIRENLETGKPVTEGETPYIED